ncbi:MAG: DUF507 family protein [Nitrospinae bacterium]|nr:DUF507 family protein [Nitrospinota bacterium]
MRLSRERINQLSKIIMDDFDKRDELDYLQEPNDVRLHVVKVITDELKVDDDIDAQVRKTVESYSRNIKEGSSEWEVLYEKHYKLEMAKKGFY